MKKLSFVLVLVLLLQLCSVSAYAADTKHIEITELDMELDIPADYVAFTRDIDSSDKNLKKYGYTKSSLLSLFQERNIYLDAWDENAQHEIMVTMVDSILGDYNLYSDTTLLTLSSAAKDLFTEMGYDSIDISVQQEKQAKFIVYTLKNTSEKISCVEYNTVYADKTINVSFFTYSNGDYLTDYLFQYATAFDVIDSVTFKTDPGPKPTPEYTPSFEYCDSETGLSFTVPEYWVEVPLSKEREIIVAKFGSKKEEGLSIMYGRVDAWGEMSVTERVGLKRADLDNSYFTEEDLAVLSDAGFDNVTKKTYGEKEYYQYSQQSKQNIYGLDVDVVITVLARVENGYMYQFLFYGTPDNQYYRDFEELVSSVQYPEVSKTTKTSGAMIAVILVAVLALVLIAILLIIKHNKKTNATEDAEPQKEKVALSSKPQETIAETTDKNESPKVEVNEVRFCTQCGQKIPAESKFCPFCGSKQ